VNSEDGDFILALQRQRYPDYEPMLEEFSIPALPPGEMTDTTPLPEVKQRGHGEAKLLLFLGLTMIGCMAYVGFSINWWWAVGWLAVMWLLTGTWRRWAKG